MSNATVLVLCLLAATAGYSAAARQRSKDLHEFWETNRQLLHRNTIDDGLDAMVELAEYEF